MVLGQGGGSSGREMETQHHPQPGRTLGKVLEDNCVVKETPEEDDLGESWSTTVFSSSLTRPTVGYPKALLEGFPVRNG